LRHFSSATLVLSRGEQPMIFAARIAFLPHVRSRSIKQNIDRTAWRRIVKPIASKLAMERKRVDSRVAALVASAVSAIHRYVE
jgi:hypothetical protein